MHSLTVFIFLFAGAFCNNDKPQINGDVYIDPFIFEDLINSTIEGLRPDIPDPLLIETLDFSLPDEPDAVITGGGNIANLNVTGLQGFQITALNFELIGMQLNFTLVFPQLDLYTDYDINVTIANALSLFGLGNVTVHLDEVTIAATAQANLTGGISVDNVLVQLSLGESSTFEIHGLLNDEDVSELVSSILNDLAAKLIDDNQELITQIISPIIETIVNAILGALLQPTTAPPMDVTVSMK